MSRLGLDKSTLVACAGLILVLAYYVYLEPMLLTPFGIRSVTNHGVGLALAALGQLTVLLIGGIDLSIGSIIALTNCVASTYLVHDPVQAVLVCVSALVVGTLCGLINGLLVVVSRIQPIIITLATSYIFTGAALYVRPSPGGDVPDFLHTLLSSSAGYVPHSLILLLVLMYLFWRPLFQTRLGKAIYAVGDNENAAFLSGLPVTRAKLAAYAIGGFIAASAGLFLTAETTSGDAGIGETYTLASIAAAVLGGVSLAGGRGGMLGPVAAALLISVLIGVLFAAGISTFYQNVFEGGILLAVLLAGRLQLLRENDWLAILRAD